MGEDRWKGAEVAAAKGALVLVFVGAVFVALFGVYLALDELLRSTTRCYGQLCVEVERDAATVMTGAGLAAFGGWVAWRVRSKTKAAMEEATPPS